MTRASFDHHIGTDAQRLRNRQADRSGHLQIHRQLELRGLLRWQVPGLAIDQGLCVRRQRDWERRR